ncbi:MULTISPECIES: phosphate ABC transporter substrate-binding protein [unclassified Pseudoalteromonas]|uniref:phosphate ABC transporter substrate-binding protein n=1 Tax=unclassified Pseudoalteromonas TaxID=194690 RepID=UPI0015D51073|nr:MULTISPECIES: phosphate ABC transporter substrate-binding protein [unclassified Pseudoalteromonas]MDP2635601.1 phosphate ABC transporter substrate-binding protein [Pseudoalteromonas sp. 1_MG-2023]
MIVFKKVLLPLLLLSCYSVNAEVVVIVHPSNSSSFDQSEISKFFLGKAKSFSDGNQAVPINQEDSSTVRKEFDSNVLSKSGSQLKAYWSKLIFTGKGSPPKEVSNDADVIDLISKNPSMIGYVDAASLNDTVKSVGKF